MFYREDKYLPGVQLYYKPPTSNPISIIGVQLLLVLLLGYEFRLLGIIVVEMGLQ
jgi:hypothetical protein